MPVGRPVRRFLPCLPLVAFATCGSPAADSSIGEWRVEGVDTLIGPNEAFLGIPVDLVVPTDGRVWIADPDNHQLVVVGPGAGTVSTVGREGDENWSATARMIAPVYLAEDSTAVSPSLGQGGSLVVHFDLRIGERRLLGNALAQRPRVMDLNNVRQQALKREFPVEFRNNVVAVTRGERVWVASQFTGAVLNLSSEGDTIWAAQLPAALVEAGTRAYFASVEREPTRVHLPVIVADAELVGK